MLELRGNPERECRVCGALHRRGRGATCSPWCADAWRVLRQHVGEFREAQRAKNARVRIRYATTDREREQFAAHAQRIADGTVRFNGRWLIEGSQAYVLGLECARRQLPIVGQLPAEIQEQLAAATAA